MSAVNQKVWKLAEIRKAWQDYFTKQNHKKIPSASLIPAGDPSLLFTTAGMVQFKSYFAGTATPPAPRVFSIQKCLRTTDLEEVGKTDRHCTFFEMLGNFSFGDYFKIEAIHYAWDFSLKVLGIDPEKIFITVYEDDDEAVEIWHKQIGVPMSRIARLGKKDNWWGPAGETGACGPCSELYLDRGLDSCKKSACKTPGKCVPGDDNCNRYMEYWNLVFNQFHQDENKKLHPLPQTGIDTGAGLERMAALLNGLASVYDTDEMVQVIGNIEELTARLRDDGKKVAYEINKNAAPFRVITDHARSATFAIADGIFPDKTGRGYVIRRLIRRALFFARELGVHKPILHELVPLLAEIYEPFYPGLKARSAGIQKRIKLEEDRFLHTLGQGFHYYSEYLEKYKQSKATVFSGEDAFKLYDTFGFPVEMTAELVQGEGMQLDRDAYARCMKTQQAQSRDNDSYNIQSLPADLPVETGKQTQFLGYESVEVQAGVLALVSLENQSVASLTDGQRGMVILDRTCFYAEGGGQIGDQGKLTANGLVFEVYDTKKSGGLFLHIGEVRSGVLKCGSQVLASIDQSNRQAITRHHSATHLLNQVLRDRLGTHVMQTGSLVNADYLRFDFSHFERIAAEDLRHIESDVLHAIMQSGSVHAEVLPLDQARMQGAVAAFDEKYGTEVRVISMGKKGSLSMEFCGGCHVQNTGDIKLFHIIREASPGAGNRRIEALAGDRVVDYFQGEMDTTLAALHTHNHRVQALPGAIEPDTRQKLLLELELPEDSASNLLQKPLDVLNLAAQLQTASFALQNAERDLIKTEKSLAKSRSGALLERVDEMLASAQNLGDLRIVQARLQVVDPGSLRRLADKLKEKSRGVVILFAVDGKKPLLLFTADKKAVAAGVDCAALIRDVAGLIGGGGGGRADMAQAGGKDHSGLDAALKLAMENLQSSM